jgi:hypothetical protein
MGIRRSTAEAPRSSAKAMPVPPELRCTGKKVRNIRLGTLIKSVLIYNRSLKCNPKRDIVAKSSGPLMPGTQPSTPGNEFFAA